MDFTRTTKVLFSAHRSSPCPMIGMAYSEIKTAERCRSFIFPAVNILIDDGREYKFIVFGRKRLLKILGDKKVGTF